MEKIISIIVTVLICSTCFLASAETWTEESARQEAFRNIHLQADVSQYAAVDPDFEENQKALKLNRLIQLTAVAPRCSMLGLWKSILRR
ncbi:MAG: hypothetical protein HY210_00995, partial [Candidatus Omnitrophica bacterium]|nr:hypothetical protein [Candidatus Omnitrophota bacterium]